MTKIEEYLETKSIRDLLMNNSIKCPQKKDGNWWTKEELDKLLEHPYYTDKLKEINLSINSYNDKIIVRYGDWFIVFKDDIPIEIYNVYELGDIIKDELQNILICIGHEKVLLYSGKGYSEHYTR